MSEPGTAFSSPDAASFWRYIRSSIERMVVVAERLEPAGLHWRPPARDANSVAVLVTHTIGNAEENILQTLCGGRVDRWREDEFVPRQTTAGELRTAWDASQTRLEHALAELSHLPWNPTPCILAGDNCRAAKS